MMNRLIPSARASFHWRRGRWPLRAAALAGILGCLALGPGFAVAADAEEKAWTVRAVFDPLDWIHEFFSERVYRFAYWADDLLDEEVGRGPMDAEARRARFFADRRIHDDTRSSYVRITPLVRLSEGGEAEFDTDFSAHLRLPRAQQRARLLLDRNDWQSSLARDFEGASGAETFAREDSRGSAGLLFRIYDATGLHFNAGGGMSFRPEPEPRLQMSLQARRPLGADYFLLPRQGVFWDADEGFGERTSLDVEKLLTPNLRLRPGAEMIWSETSEGVDLSQYVSLFYFLSDRRMIGVKAGVFEHTRPSAVVEEYRIRFPYRQRVWKEWLFVRFEPGGRFLREEDYGFKPELIIAIDLFAGHVQE